MNFRGILTDSFAFLHMHIHTSGSNARRRAPPTTAPAHKRAAYIRLYKAYIWPRGGRRPPLPSDVLFFSLAILIEVLISKVETFRKDLRAHGFLGKRDFFVILKTGFPIPRFQDPKICLDRSAGNKHSSRKKDFPEAIPRRNSDQSLLKAYNETDDFETETKASVKHL